MSVLDEWLVCKQEIINEEPLTYGSDWLSIFVQIGLIIPTDRFNTAVDSITDYGMTGYEEEMSG